MLIFLAPPFDNVLNPALGRVLQRGPLGTRADRFRTQSVEAVARLALRRHELAFQESQKEFQVREPERRNCAWFLSSLLLVVPARCFAAADEDPPKTERDAFKLDSRCLPGN